MVTSFGVRLKFAREHVDMTQEELAKRIGCSRALINHYENDRKLPRMKNLKLLAQTLGRPQDFFLDERVSIISPAQLKYLDYVSASGCHLEYECVMGEAIEAGITPEELRECIAFIKKIRQAHSSKGANPC